MMEMLGGAFDSSQIPIIGITGQPITTMGGNCTRVGMDPLELQRRLGCDGPAPSWLDEPMNGGCYGGIVAQSRQRSLEEAILQVITGKNMRTIMNMHEARGYKTPMNWETGRPAIGGILDDMVGGMVGAAFARERQRVATYETDRSREALGNWQLSRSQHEALMAEAAQRGIRNL